MVAVVVVWCTSASATLAGRMGILRQGCLWGTVAVPSGGKFGTARSSCGKGRAVLLLIFLFAYFLKRGKRGRAEEKDGKGRKRRGAERNLRVSHHWPR